MKESIARRELFGAAASGLAGLVIAACGASAGGTQIVDTPEGKVVQWEGDELLMLVSGVNERYQLGEQIQLKVILNNQSSKVGLYRVRIKLAGRAQQVVAEAPVSNVQVKPYDAGELERTITLAPSIGAGEYSVIVELPPWSLEGRSTGGGSVTIPLRVM